MFASPFAYHRPGSIVEAQRLLSAHPGAMLLAGGHSLLPLLKLRLAAPDVLIDIGRIAELKGISEQSGRLRLGATTTHAEIASSDLVQQHCAVLADAAGRIGDPAVRNRGTIGGSISHADPGADLPSVLVALGATIEITGSGGSRTIPADSFFMGLMATALGHAEIVTAVSIPALGPGHGAAYVKFAHPASRYAVIGVAAAVVMTGGTISGARIVAGGLVPKPTRLTAVERALAGQPATSTTAENAAAQTSAALGDEVIGDVFASADYRRAVAGTYVARAIAGAMAQAA